MSKHKILFKYQKLKQICIQVIWAIVGNHKTHQDWSRLMFLPAIRSTQTNTLTWNNIVTDQMSLGCQMMIIFHLQLSTVKPSECLLLFPPNPSPHNTHRMCKPIKTVSVCAVAECNGRSSVYISLSWARPCQARLYSALLHQPSTQQHRGPH